MSRRSRILDRYLGVWTLKGFFLVLFLLLVLFSFFELLVQVNDVGKGEYRLADAFVYVALTLPRRMGDLLPLAALLGAIVALGLLADRRELTAMQAAGISPRRLAAAVLTTGLFLMAGGLAWSEFVAPPLDQQARVLKTRAVAGPQVWLQKEGFWLRHENAYVRVGRAGPGGRATDVERYEIDASGRLARFVYAPEAAIDPSGDWVLARARIKRFEEDAVVEETREILPLEGFLAPNQLAVLELPPDTLSLSDLWRLIRSLEARRENAKAYALAFWQKLCQPVTTGALMLLALSFVFGPTRTRTAAQRIFAGMIVGIAFTLLSQILGHIGLLSGWPPLWTTLAPAALAGGAALRLLRKVI